MTHDEAKVEVDRLFHDGVEPGSVWRRKRNDERCVHARVLSVDGHRVSYRGEEDDWWYQISVIWFRQQFEPEPA